MLLEICIDRLESVLAAEAGGANRLEVCGSLVAGGTTPSRGLIEHCQAVCQLDLMMMIRPHDGSFCYGRDDLEIMQRDIRLAGELGVRGVVFGALREDGRVDMASCRRLMDAARPLEVTFHRAFDLARDPFEALDVLLELGVDRLLTSGQAPSAAQGAACIGELVRRSENRLVVMAGAGMDAANVKQVIRQTGASEIHASASVAVDDTACQRELGFGASYRVTCRRKVRELIAAMNST